MQRITWLHFDYITKDELRNLAQITAGIHQAARQGAGYILTPELAVQGYPFTQQEKGYRITEDIESLIRPVLAAAAEEKVWVFLGCAVRDWQDGNPYNSCLIINPAGTIVGRHDKHSIHVPAEAWSTPGMKDDWFACDGIRMGILVCADAWYDENGTALGKLGVDAIVLVAAWPPGCGGPPEDAWKRCSCASGGHPVLVCNQTGKDGRMDCTIAMSGIVQGNQVKMSYISERSAILLADMDMATGQLGQDSFMVLPFSGEEIK